MACRFFNLIVCPARRFHIPRHNNKCPLVGGGAIRYPACPLPETLKTERGNKAMFDVASASAVFTTLLSNISTILGSTVIAVLGIFAALLGLGLAIRWVRKYIAGRKA